MSFIQMVNLKFLVLIKIKKYWMVAMKLFFVNVGLLPTELHSKVIKGYEYDTYLISTIKWVNLNMTLPIKKCNISNSFLLL